MQRKRDKGLYAKIEGISAYTSAREKRNGKGRRPGGRDYVEARGVGLVW